LVRRYEASYRRRPETPREIDEATVLAAKLLSGDDGW
jgi:hypothetical protein